MSTIEILSSDALQARLAATPSPLTETFDNGLVTLDGQTYRLAEDAFPSPATHRCLAQGGTMTLGPGPRVEVVFADGVTTCFDTREADDTRAVSVLASAAFRQRRAR